MELVLELSHNSDDQLFLFPNPAAYLVNISMPVVFTNGRLTIHNMMGQLLYSETVHKNKVSLKIGLWQSGIYYVTYTSANKLVRNKLVVQH